MGAEPSIPLVCLPKDRVVVITGGNTGIGYETAKFIAMMGANVIIACRSEEKAKRAIEQMNQEFQEEKEIDTQNIISEDRLNVEFMKLDLASLQSTMDFIENFKASGKKLHVLICNAGIYMHKEVITSDGYELTYQVNYLSQFLITAHMLPIMKESGDDVRIILVTSAAHKYGKYNANYAAGVKMEEYDAFQSFTNTKLYQIMQMYSFDKRLVKTHVEIHCVHPGFVEQDLFRRNENLTCKFKCIRCCLSCLCMTHSAHKGSASSIYAAVSPDLKHTSRAYLVHSRDAPRFPSTIARDSKLQSFLLECTIDNLKDYLPQEFIKEFSKS